MAHFAEINTNNVVLRVLVVPDDQEHRGEEYLSTDLGLGGRWLKCSYNTVSGVHKNGKDPFRGTYPSEGYVYDESLDRFTPRKPFDSWHWDEEMYSWQPPFDKPNDGIPRRWDESVKNWVEIES